MGNVLDFEVNSSNVDDNVKYDSFLEVIPLQGRAFKFKIHRTRYWIKSHQKTFFCATTSTVYLYSNKNFSYCLEWDKAINSRPKWKLKLETGYPFAINGIDAESVFLKEGDRVKIGSHSLFFPKSKILANDKISEIQTEIIESKLPIFLQGETGTGKTAMAYRIHQQSGVLGKFVHLNLSSISSSLFESEIFGHTKGAFTGAMNEKMGVLREAHNGTLFLDEINSLSLEMQTKLLLVLENQKVRPIGSNIDINACFRLITSSNESLDELVSNGRMRKDFYYRISSGEKILLPNINSSEVYFYEIVNKLESELDIIIPRALKEFYWGIKWEGNIRELKNYLQKKRVLQGKRINYCLQDDNLKRSNRKNLSYLLKDCSELKTLNEIKKDYVKLVFERCERNITATSQILNISHGTIRAILYEAKI